jgi:dienelactone hydrolase
MRERPITLGRKKELVGVVTEPAPDQRDPGRPACILVNAGLIHRVGPNRLYVNLARRLAGRGMVTLRLDLSGRGDSDVSKDARSFTESAIDEIRAAMDALETSRQCRQFVIGGICSGAINALQVAMADERVAGGIMIDGPAYPTAGYYVRYYARRLFSRESWKNTLA